VEVSCSSQLYPIMKKDHQNLGLFTQYQELGEAPLFLPHGEALVKSLIDKWREMHTEMGFQFLHSFSHDPKQMHRTVFSREGFSTPCRFASFGPSPSDLVSIFCRKAGVVNEIISSLHFLEQTIKIFGFETRVYLVANSAKDKPFFQEALKQLNLSYKEEEDVGAKVEFRLVDTRGKEHVGPYVAFEEYSKDVCLIYRSLFGSMEKWVAFLLEKQLNGRSR
jgi:threonyl-tRNA synthetase